MKTRILPAGDAALLVEVDGVEEVLALTAALRAGAAADIEDVVPAATTVLVLASPGGDLGELGATVSRIAEAVGAGEDLGADGDEVRLPVRYDGPDLGEVAELTGLSRSEVIARHTGAQWRAAFGGFAPGFAYLVGGDPALEVPRRRESRTAVPAGAVALAGGYSAVYPAESPGGWQLIGTTDARLWDVDRDPPALIRPGTVVRFFDEAGTSDGGVTDVAAGDVAAGDVDAGTGSADTAADASLTGPSGAESRTRIAATHFEVVRTGPLSLFQDAGRPGNAAIGVGRSGAADRSAYELANRLVGNDDGAVVIESVLGGLSVRAGGDVVVAVTGAQLQVTVDGEPAELGAPLELRAGQLLKLGTPKQGLRSYLAVRGGFDVPEVLGSCSTDTLSGVGPPPIARGDRLGVRAGFEPDAAGKAGGSSAVGGSDGSTQDGGLAEVGAEDHSTDPAGTGPKATTAPMVLRVVSGPRDDWFTTPSDLAVGEWVVSPNSNRVGVRLDRPSSPVDGPDLADAAAPSLQRSDSRELPSEGVTLGAIQVPPSGQPVLFLADHPVTGGYPVIAVVVTGDVDRAAQARPGQRIRFEFQQPAH